MPDDIKKGGFDCYDCAGPQWPYMVHELVWLQAFPDYYEIKVALKRQQYVGDDRIVTLCFDCIEKRLDRKLEAEDFTGAPINVGVLKSLAWWRTDKAGLFAFAALRKRAATAEAKRKETTA